MVNAYILYEENPTQPWVLISEEGSELFRANTFAKCQRHAQWKGHTVTEEPQQELAEEVIEFTAQQLLPDSVNVSDAEKSEVIIFEYFNNFYFLLKQNYSVSSGKPYLIYDRQTPISLVFWCASRQEWFHPMIGNGLFEILSNLSS